MTWWHPRSATLERCVRGTASERVTRHVAACERCTSTLDRETAPSAEMREALAAVTVASPSFAVEIGPRVLGELRGRRPFALVADLFGAGWDTVWLMTEWEEDHGGE